MMRSHHGLPFHWKFAEQTDDPPDGGSQCRAPHRSADAGREATALVRRSADIRRPTADIAAHWGKVRSESYGVFSARLLRVFSSGVAAFSLVPGGD